MILEIATITVKAGQEAEFEAGVTKSKALFARAKGNHGLELHKSFEHPLRYRLMIEWDTVENHMKDFRESADYQEWRKLVGHTFDGPVEVEHTHVVVS